MQGDDNIMDQAYREDNEGVDVVDQAYDAGNHTMNADLSFKHLHKLT